VRNITIGAAGAGAGAGLTLYFLSRLGDLAVAGPEQAAQDAVRV
jgi:hypothetical protein